MVKKRTLLAGIVFFMVFRLDAQHRDSVIRKYLVCKSTSFLKKSRIIKNGTEVWVRDTTGQKLRGILNILNDSVMEVRTYLTERCDTFKIGAVNKVRKPNSSVSIMQGAIGIALIAIGGPLLQEDDFLNQFLGGYLVLSGAGMLLGTAVGINGKKYRQRYYKFHIIQTKGFILRKRHIGNL
jgi:hypothetical protein